MHGVRAHEEAHHGLTEDYVKLFEALRAVMMERGMQRNPKCFMVDFEAGNKRSYGMTDKLL